MLNIIQNTIGAIRRVGESVVRAGLKMWLPFTKADVGATTQTTLDISGNNNNAILKTGKCLVFHANDSIETSFPTSKDIKTIAFWIYPTASNTNETLFWFGGSSFGSKYVLLNHLTLTSSPYARTDFDVYVNGVFAGATFGGQSVTLVQDQWQRVVLKSSTAINVTSNTFHIAEGAAAGGSFKMADLQIYGAEFATDDIAFDYANPQKLVTDNASSSVTLNDLDLYLAMTEGAGSIAYDSSGGTAYNGTTLGATYEDAQDRILQLGMISWAKSTPVSDEIVLPYNPNNVTQDILGNAVRVKGSGFNLDGTGYAEVLDDASINPTTAITIGCWVYFEGNKNDLGIVGKWEPNKTDYLITQLFDGSNRKLRFYLNTTDGLAIISSPAIVGDKWVYVACTYNKDAGSNNTKIYTIIPDNLDGSGNQIIQKGIGTHTGSINDSDNNITIGQYTFAASTFFDNKIDDVKIYNTDLSEAQIEQNYNATKSGHNN